MDDTFKVGDHEYILTTHAKERAIERDISLEDIAKVLTSGLRTFGNDGGKEIKRYRLGKLFVVVSIGTVNLIITVIDNDFRKLKKRKKGASVGSKQNIRRRPKQTKSKFDYREELA